MSQIIENKHWHVLTVWGLAKTARVIKDTTVSNIGAQIVNYDSLKPAQREYMNCPECSVRGLQHPADTASLVLKAANVHPCRGHEIGRVCGVPHHKT